MRKSMWFWKKKAILRPAVAPAAPKAKAKAKAKAAPGPAIVQVEDRSYPAIFPLRREDSEWTASALSRLLPPDDTKAYFDKVNFRWQLFWTKTRHTRYWSFVRHGLVGGGSALLSTAWSQYRRLSGTEAPWANHG